MSRFAANPKWLIYLPPTMSPCETSDQDGLAGTPDRGVRLLPQPGRAAGRLRREAHGLPGGGHRLPGRAGGPGAVRRSSARPASSTPARAGGSSTTRLWRRQFLARVRAAMDASGFWAQFNTSWACLDCELMPWSAKAQELLRSQYAAVGAAGRASLPKAVAALRAGCRAAGRPRPVRPVQLFVGCRRDTPALREPGQGDRAVRRRLSAVLLAGGVAGRPEAGPVSPAGDRREGPHRPGSRLAHGDAGRDLPARSETACSRRRSRSSIVTDPESQKRGRRLVAGTDRAGRRGHGGQAASSSSPAARRALPSRP